MRFAFFGSPPFAIASFSAMLEAGINVVGLVTAPPRLAGRGRKESSNPLVDLARVAAIPTLRPESACETGFLQAFETWNVDLGVVVSYGQLLKQSLLDLPTHGCVNLHGSLLPRWRGASPVQAAILAGDSVTGVSLQKMVLALDAGAVLAESRLPMSGRETAPQLTEALSVLGAKLLLAQLQVFEALQHVPAGKEQEDTQCTFCKRIRKQDGVLNWESSGEDIDRRVRAMAGWPGAQSFFPDGSRVRIHAGKPQPEVSQEVAAGTIVSLEEGILVACGKNSYRIEELQREGKTRIKAKEFLHGSPLQIGQNLTKESQ